MSDAATDTAPVKMRGPARLPEEGSLRGAIEGLLKQRSGVEAIQELEMIVKLGQEAARLVEDFYASGAPAGVLRIEIEADLDGKGREIKLRDYASPRAS
ncbi:hypothetical protein [Lichenifustis flavocetrariae]|uniref:Uncharacterized protein n=1 Tax=Lichenifustis flavocetrariae TaxID=2949735 RepID=A0AA41ZB35_9HYPH|nr:hypothetical protein [Lichenifustis flavocetrariae]MCW6512627.1 hypothetical protein [Lichenifustis flavocetrariae]